MPNHKELIAQIKKMALDPFPGSAETGSTGTTPVGGGAPVRPAGDPGIKKMQQAIQQLSKDVAEQMKGAESFGDFLARTFMRNNNVPAIEFSPDDKKTKMEDKDPTAANKMSWVMKTMDRIGHAISETWADGVWGPRTHAALVNVIAFANGLFNVAKAFKIPVKSYNEQWLSQLQPLVETTSEQMSSEDKKADAPTVTKHINLIRQMFDEIKNQVLNIPKYQTYIEGDTPYLSHDKSGFHPNPQQLASMQQTFSQGFSIPIGNEQSAEIFINDLSSMQALNQWAEGVEKRTGIKPDLYNALAMVANQVSQQGKGA